MRTDGANENQRRDMNISILRGLKIAIHIHVKCACVWVRTGDKNVARGRKGFGRADDAKTLIRSPRPE